MRNFISTIALASAALACSSTEETPQRGQMQASIPAPPVQHEQEVRSAEGILELAAEEGQMLVEPQEPTEDGKEERDGMDRKGEGVVPCRGKLL